MKGKKIISAVLASAMLCTGVPAGWTLAEEVEIVELAEVQQPEVEEVEETESAPVEEIEAEPVEETEAEPVEETEAEPVEETEAEPVEETEAEPVEETEAEPVEETEAEVVEETEAEQAEETETEAVEEPVVELLPPVVKIESEWEYSKGDNAVIIPCTEDDEEITIRWEFDGEAESYVIEAAPADVTEDPVVVDTDELFKVDKVSSKKVKLETADFADGWYMLFITAEMEDGTAYQSEILVCLEIEEVEAEPEVIVPAEEETEASEQDDEINAVATALAITKQPANVAVAVGEKATVTFTAVGEGLTYEWYFKDTTHTKFYKTTAFTSNKYTVDMTEARNGRQIYCVVTDANGNQVQTNTVTISVAAASSLSITKQPTNVAVAVGEKATVTFTAVGEGLTYEWYFKDTTHTKFYKTTAFTSNKYTVDMTEARDGRQIYCVVTDANGNKVQTNTVTISVAAASSLSITKQPTNVTVAAGEKAIVTFTAAGEGLTYEWYFKDATGSKFTKTTAFTSNKYTVEMTAARSGRQLYCVVTDANGNKVQTNTVTISMASEKAVQITKQPENVAVAVGEKATVTFSAAGEGLTYEWYFKDATASKFSKTSSFTGNYYTVEMTEARNGRQLYCVVTDASGNKVQTNTVTISIQSAELKITKQPTNVAVAVGEKATVTFEATGNGLTYEWYYKEATGSKFNKTAAFTSNKYTVEMTEARNGRQLYCVVTDANGNKVQTNTVTISVKAAIEITKQPTDVAVANGEKAIVSFEAIGNGLTYEWYFKNAGAASFVKTTAFKSNVYSVDMDASRDGRQLYCVVTDANGNKVQTNTVTISMAAALEITVQPVNVGVALGQKAVVSFEVSGNVKSYEWYFKDVTASKFSKTAAYTSNTYSIEMTEARNGRQVYCVVTDVNGNKVQTNTVSINIATPLEITVQPVDVWVNDGETAAVTFEAVGDGLTYAWYFSDNNGVKWSTTTAFKSNSYSVAMNESRNGRMLYCVVTDAYGNTVTTNTVTIGMKVIDNLHFDFNAAGTGIIITEYAGTAANVVVPEIIANLPVTEIGDEAFYNNTALVSIDLPDTVERIGVRAFAGCTALSEMN